MTNQDAEATAVADSVTKPWKPMLVALRGVKTEGPMAPDIPLDKARPAEFVFQSNVQKLSEMRADEAQERAARATAAE